MSQATTETPAKPSDSLRKRYAAKLSANVLGAPLTLATQSLATRLVGVDGYGTFSLLTNFFQGLTGLLDAGVSTCFYTKLSQRPTDLGLKLVITRLFLGLTLVATAFCLVAFATGWSKWIWLGKHAGDVWLALAYSLALWGSQLIGLMIDAHGLTVWGEKLRLLQRVFALTLLAGMFWRHWNSLGAFFGANISAVLFVAAGWWWVMRREGFPVWPVGQLDIEARRECAREFWRYSQPLVVYAAVGFVAGYGERWLLERFGGTTQQGFYGLALQTSAVCFLFISAMTPLFTREFAIAHGRDDQKRMTMLFERLAPAFYAVAAYFSLFVCLEAKEIALLAGGDKFRGAGPALAVMALYPIHQTYGQLNGSVFFATGNTRRYRNIGVLTMITGLLFTAWVLAPRRVGGLELGSTGLAYKMVLIQFLSVNLQVWWNARLLGLSFRRILIRQVAVVVAFGTVAWLSRFIVARAVTSMWPAFFLSGFAYTLACGGLLVAWPRLVNVSREELTGRLRAGLNFARG